MLQFFVPLLFIIVASRADAVEAIQNADLACSAVIWEKSPSCQSSSPVIDSMVRSCQLEYEAAQCEKYFENDPKIKEENGLNCTPLDLCKDRLYGAQLGFYVGMAKGLFIDSFEIVYQAMLDDGNAISEHLKLKAEERQKLIDQLSTLSGKREYVKSVPSLSALSDSSLASLSINELTQRKRAFLESEERTTSYMKALSGPRPTPREDSDETYSLPSRNSLELLQTIDSLPSFQELKDLAIKAIEDKTHVSYYCYNKKGRGELLGGGISMILNPSAPELILLRLSKTKNFVQASARIGRTAKTEAIANEAAKSTALSKLSREEFLRSGRGTDQSRIWQLRHEGKAAEAAALESQIANRMTNSPIIEMTPIGFGDSRGSFVKLEDGTLGVWKPADGTAASIGHEVAAYKIDKQIGLNQVPITVERKMNGQNGSLQLFVASDQAAMGRAPESLSQFDFLIGNFDRTQANFLTTSGQLVLIDHGKAFGKVDLTQYPDLVSKLVDKSKTFKSRIENLKSRVQSLEKSTATNPSARSELQKAQEQLENQIQFQKEFRDQAANSLPTIVMDREAYLNLLRTPESQWRAILKPSLSSREVRDFISRREAVIGTIESLRREFGEGIFRAGPVSPLVRQTDMRTLLRTSTGRR